MVRHAIRRDFRYDDRTARFCHRTVSGNLFLRICEDASVGPFNGAGDNNDIDPSISDGSRDPMGATSRIEPCYRRGRDDSANYVRPVLCIAWRVRRHVLLHLYAQRFAASR